MEAMLCYKFSALVISFPELTDSFLDVSTWGSSQLNLGKVWEESTKFGDESTKVRDDSTKDRDESSKVWN